MKSSHLLTRLALLGLASTLVLQTGLSQIDGYHEFNYGGKKGGENWIQSIEVSTPSPRAEVRGDVEVKFRAPGMARAKAMCWQQPESTDSSPWGHDKLLTPQGITLDAEGNGAFVFPADRFPNGPVNVRIFAHNDQGKQDIFELQLFNLGGVKWNQGIPKTNPPGAKGLELIFSDDFDGPLSISNDGRGARYSAHKPRFGDFSGWQFSDVLGDGKPFGQTGTWLNIAARKDEVSPQGRSGLIASVNMDGEGIWVKAPAYLECRFTAQSAIGTWPAFWTITTLDKGIPGDELDIVEAYGGVGKGNPNHIGYSIVSHFWMQKNPDGTPKKSASAVVPIMELGGKSYWSTTFHTYGVSIGLEETVYYFDDIEVLRHPTNDVSRDTPHCFLVNYAIAGISRWPIDLKRYGNGTDMWVDYIRVYAKGPIDYKLPPQNVSSTLPPAEAAKSTGQKLPVAAKKAENVPAKPSEKPAGTVSLRGFAGLNAQVAESDNGETIRISFTVPAEKSSGKSFAGFTKKIDPPRQIESLSFSVAGAESDCLVQVWNEKGQMAYAKPQALDALVQIPSLRVKGSVEPFEGKVKAISVEFEVVLDGGEQEVSIQGFSLQP